MFDVILTFAWLSCEVSYEVIIVVIMSSLYITIWCHKGIDVLVDVINLCMLRDRLTDFARNSVLTVVSRAMCICW